MSTRGVLASIVVLTALVAGAPRSQSVDVAPAPASVPAPDSASAHVVTTRGPGQKTGSGLIADYNAAGWPGCASTRGVVAHTLVMVIPDPLDSHLDWAFDSELESVRRAFETASYALDRYWLPWTPNAPAGDTVREAAPGVMLFRRAGAIDSLALVYLVGEIPTRGIHATAFAAALTDRATVLSAPAAACRAAGPTRDGPAPVVHEELRIVGPTFSGSARSLRRALNRAQARGVIGTVSVVSGSAAVRSNTSVIATDTTADSLTRIRFAATVHPTDLLKHRIETALTERLGISLREIAYLTESGTPFGTQFRDTTQARAPSARTPARAPDTALGAPELDAPLALPFPMNISRLRREYARDVRPSDTSGRAQTSLTRIDWRDPAALAESPAPFSDWTAPTIERTLDDIEQTLTLHHIQAVGILATDVRDRLFVASLVKQRLRDIRVFFISSHSLYLRPELSGQLRGSLVVSTYPLLLEGQFWDLAHRGRDRLVFTSDLSEGTYNATLAQLHLPERMTDYEFPMQRHGAFRPPVWITTVGVNALLPVVADSSPDSATGPAYLLARDTLDTRRLVEASTGSLEPAMLTIALSAALCVALIWHRADCARPRWTSGKTDGHADPWASERRVLVWHLQLWERLRFLAIACASASLMLVLARAQAHGSRSSHIALGVVVGTLVLPWIAAGRRSRAHDAQLPRGDAPSAWHHASAYALTLVYPLLTALFVVQIGSLQPAESAMFFLRALALTSGVTPVVPLLVGATLLIAWCTWHLHRVVLLGELSAFEVACRQGKIATPNPGRGHRSKIAADVGGAVKDVRDGLLRLRPRGTAVGLMIALALLGGWVLAHFDRSLETLLLGGLFAGFGAEHWLALPGSFDLLFRFLVFAALTLCVWTLYRLLVVWSGLRACLQSVEALPIASGFGRLPRSIAGLMRFTPFNAPRAEVVDRTLDHAALARWRALSAATFPAYAADLARLLASAPNACPALRSGYGDFDETISVPLGTLYAALRKGARTGDPAVDLTEPTPADVASPIVSIEHRSWSDLTQELVALYIIDYLEWVVRHLRHLAFSLVVSVVLTTILLSCYPFEPESLVEVLFFALAAAAIATIGSLLFQMNRDTTMSRITGTTPGQITWDTQLVVNLALAAGVPILTLIGAEFPAVRSFLFSWVTPLIKALGKG